MWGAQALQPYVYAYVCYTSTAYDIITSAKTEVMRSCRFVCHSVCLCAASRNKLCVDLQEMFTEGRFGPVSRWFYFGGGLD